MRKIILTILVMTSLIACPLIDNQVDWNCDGKLKLVFFGDSITEGFHTNGGYVSRLKKYLPNAEVRNFGISGITSKELLKKIRHGYGNVSGADYVFVSVGINDYKYKGRHADVIKNISGIVSKLKDRFISRKENLPIIKVGTITPSKRSGENKFIKNVNNSIRKVLSVGPDFNTLSPKLISGDGKHPSLAGFEKMSEILFNYIDTKLKKELVSE